MGTSRSPIRLQQRLALIVLLAAGCAVRGSHQQPAAPSSDDIVITKDEIARMDGVQTAWDVLLRRLPARFSVRGGVPMYEVHRGATSAAARPLLVLDGVKLDDWRDVITVPVASIEEIRLLGSISGSILYGADARAGVIMVETIPRS